jgi:hypothetical protein
LESRWSTYYSADLDCTRLTLEIHLHYRGKEYAMKPTDTNVPNALHIVQQMSVTTDQILFLPRVRCWLGTCRVLKHTDGPGDLVK